MKVALYMCVVTLLLIYGTASAEFSYVLWSLLVEDGLVHGKQKDQKKRDSSESVKWHPRSSFPGNTTGITVCYQFMKETAGASKHFWEGAVEPKGDVAKVRYSYSGGEASIHVVWDGASIFEQYRCLPDTVNPNH